MKDVHPLRTILEDAARGRFPPADGGISVLPAPPGRSDAVIACTAYHVIAANVDPDEAVAHLPSEDVGAPMSVEFLTWLGRRLGSQPGSLDVVLAAPGLPGPDPEQLLRESQPMSHTRVDRADRYREHVSVYTDLEETSVVVLGNGLTGRREISLEIEETARGRGRGHRLLLAARTLVPEEEFLFAQVAPGNAASLRAFLAAGFTPIGGEVLFLRQRSGGSGPRARARPEHG